MSETIELFRPNNTRGYSAKQLANLNAAWAEIVAAEQLEPGTDEYHAKAAAFCDVVAGRADMTMGYLERIRSSRRRTPTVGEVLAELDLPAATFGMGICGVNTIDSGWIVEAYDQYSSVMLGKPVYHRLGLDDRVPEKHRVVFCA